MKHAILVVLAAAAPCSAQWWWPPTDGLGVAPSGCITPTTAISLTISGDWPDSCIPNFSSHVVSGADIDLTTVRDPPPGGCPAIISPWSRTQTIGVLPAGTYSVYVSHRVAGTVVHPRTLIGSVTVAASCCYPNCDNSTSPPVLNANDFQCFLNLFAAQNPSANCDASTADPILNANDFQCFLNRFAEGCG